MAINIVTVVTADKEEKYKLLIPQINVLIEGETNLISNLGNVASALKFSMDNFLWTGFYLTEGGNELVLGPFQGRVACTRIPFGKGVCGTAAQKMETIIVPDVDKFPGHIVCDSLSKSEIVIPIVKDKMVMGVLDIDSDIPDNFDEIDKTYLEEIILNLVKIF